MSLLCSRNGTIGFEGRTGGVRRDLPGRRRRLTSGVIDGVMLFVVSQVVGEGNSIGREFETIFSIDRTGI